MPLFLYFRKFSLFIGLLFDYFDFFLCMRRLGGVFRAVIDFTSISVHLEKMDGIPTEAAEKLKKSTKLDVFEVGYENKIRQSGN